MVRFEDWPNRLSNYLEERREAEFIWSENDCMMFAAKGVEALTGHDFSKEFDSYIDELTAKEIAESNGGYEKIITKCLGSGSANILKAKRGDVVLLRRPEIMAGLVDDSGQRIAVVSKKGLLRIPLNKAFKYWSY